MAMGPIASSKAIVALLLLACPSVAAGGQDFATITTSQPLELGGLIHGRSAEAVLNWDAYSNALEWHVDNAFVEITRVSMPVIESPLGDISYEPEVRTERLEVDTGTITVVPAQGASIRLHGVGQLTLIANVAPGAGLPLDFEKSTAPFHYRAPSDTREFYYNAQGISDAFVFPDAGTVSASFEGDATIFIIGATVLTSDANRTTETRLSESSQRDPLLPSARRDEYSFMTIDAHALRFEGAARAIEFADATVGVEGEVRFDAIEGSAAAGQSRFPNLNGANTLVGSIEISRAAGTPAGNHYDFEGSFAGIALGNQYVAARRVEGPAAVGLVASLALIAAAARGKIGTVLGVFYTRIARSSVLENPARYNALEHLRKHPGTHLRDLQRAMGWGWGTLHYHIAVLQKANLVFVERVGKHALAYPRFGETKTPEQMLALRGHAATVYAALSGGLSSQTELVARLGLSRQLVAHHLSLLERDSLVAVVGTRPKLYHRRSASDAAQGETQVLAQRHEATTAPAAKF